MIKKGILLLLLLWGTARFTHHQTKGFRMSKLEGNTTNIESQVSPQLPKEMGKILSQEFHYLGRGLQSFSFVSEDGSVVLKLFNNRYQRRLFWNRFFPNKEKREYLTKKLAMTFESYQLAYDHYRKECGLLYFHPQKCSSCPTVTLIDPIGCKHRLNLQSHAWALQKKATLAYSYLDACSQNREKAREALFAIVSHFKEKMEKGIADRDPLIRTNLGFYQDKPMQIDLGPLSWDPTLKNREKQKREIGTILVSLQHYLEQKHPELLPDYYEALKTL